MIRVLKFWPKGKVFDFLLNISLFFYSHRRLPNRKWNFSDQIFWQKCDVRYNLSPLVCLTSDKYLVKLFISYVIGERFCVPTLDIVDTNELNSTVFYDREVVVKPRHLSGFVTFYNAGDPVDQTRYRDICSRNHYEYFREMNYKYLPKGLIVEPILYGDRNLNDIKIFFYNGKLLFLQMDSDRGNDHRRLIFDKNFRSLEISLKYPVNKHLRLPSNIATICDLIQPLGSFFSRWVRIDCYTDGNDIKIGEITHCHGSSLERVIPAEGQSVFEDYVRAHLNDS